MSFSGEYWAQLAKQVQQKVPSQNRSDSTEKGKQAAHGLQATSWIAQHARVPPTAYTRYV